MYRLMGIDPKEEFYTQEGRPVPIVNNGKVIDALAKDGKAEWAPHTLPSLDK